MSHARDEVEAAVTRLIKLRDRVSDGDGCWADLAPMFTDDVVYIDPAWGSIMGIEQADVFVGLAPKAQWRPGLSREALIAEMAEVIDQSSPGAEVAFTQPIQMRMNELIGGDTVLIKWRQVIPGADGAAYEQSGYSHLIYAGGGQFRYNEDQLNMTHVIEDLGVSGWRPPEGMSMAMPPAAPNRDFSIPDQP